MPTAESDRGGAHDAVKSFVRTVVPGSSTNPTRMGNRQMVEVVASRKSSAAEPAAEDAVEKAKAHSPFLPHTSNAAVAGLRWRVCSCLEKTVRLSEFAVVYYSQLVVDAGGHLCTSTFETVA